jgi:hypothetical protein
MVGAFFRFALALKLKNWPQTRHAPRRTPVGETTDHTPPNKAQSGTWVVWLGWAYLAKKVPHAATTSIATAFKICISHRKNGLLNRLPEERSF